MARRKPRPRKSRVRAVPQLTMADSPHLHTVARCLVAGHYLSEAIAWARAKRKKRITFDRLLFEDGDVHMAFLKYTGAFATLVQDLVSIPAVGAEERERPVSEAPPDPRRTPIRKHEAEEPDDDEEEERE